MIGKQLPDKENLIKKLQSLIDVHPIKSMRPVSMFSIFMGLLEQYPDIVSSRQLATISRRKKNPEQIAEAILFIRQHEASDIPLGL